MRNSTPNHTYVNSQPNIMLPPLFDLNILLDAIDQEASIITANQRLCSKAIEAWGYHQKSNAQSYWQAPAIYSLSQWIDQQWLNLQALGNQESFQNIVSKNQQRILWERVTKNCGRMQTEKLAKQAATALTHLSHWHLLPEYIQANDHFVSDAHYIFIQWCDEYKTLLKKNQLISEEDKINIVINAFKNKQLSKEKHCYLVGFDDLSPLIKTLFDHAIDGNIKKVINEYSPKTLARKNFNNPSDEVIAAAQWAHTILQTDPHVRIGIIAPDLGQSRDNIVNALTTVFEPQSRAIDTKQTILPFNISAGTPLGNTPWIADSLKLLNLLRNTFTLDDCLQWLYSPFWGKQSLDQDQRIRLAGQLERLEQFEISSNQLRFYAQKITENHTNNVTHSIFYYFRQAHELQRTYNFHAKASVWVERFLDFLTVLDWPGERVSDSMEYQQTQLWYQVLETFAGLDSVLGALTAREAIKELGIIARSTPFQAKVPDSPIQVLGILEGAGLQFTHCWVMGLNQQTWPPAPAPNPLLPFSLQKEHKLPHASATREFDYAQSLTTQYRRCADHIVMSYADYNEAGDIHWQPSQLIADIPQTDATQQIKTQTIPDSLPTLDIVPCRHGPKIIVEPHHVTVLKGGSSVLKTMVENPFDTFARFRLSANRINQAVSGFSAKEQGIIMHQSLASIWQTLHSQKVLMDYSDTALETLVSTAVTQAVREQQARKRSHLQDTLCKLEIDRQTALIIDWLSIEQQRPAFTVAHIEESFNVTIKGLSIDIRIDRIDQLADGSFLIIDYKTGTATLNAWKADNPSDPQLPLYLLAQSKPISGIAFAQINVKARTIKGLHNGEHAMDGIKGFQAIGDNKINLPTTWEAAKKHWQSIIEALLIRFIDGDTTIELKNANGFNKDLLPLNRFNDINHLNNYLAVRNANSYDSSES